MPWNSEELAVLRDTLATLYPMVGDSRVVVADARLDPARIAFDAKAILNWFNILQQARLHEGGVDRILALAQGEYPDDDRLRRLKEKESVSVITGPEPTRWHGERIRPHSSRL